MILIVPIQKGNPPSKFTFMKNFSIQLKKIGVAGLIVLAAQNSDAQITENFDNITTLTGSGWVMQNNSVPVGVTNWFQGNSTVFSAFNGAADSYIGANFNNTTGANTISNWLVTPTVTIKNGDVITFYTLCSPDNMYPDNLQVRMSTNGTSSNVGTGSAAVGDFTTLLLEINPSLVTGVYPYVSWTQYSITISGLSAPTSGRFAFRYYVPNGGPGGSNSDYIGIDNFVYTPYVCPTLSVTPSSLTNATAGSMYNQTLSQTGGLGTTTYSVSSGTLPPGLTLSTGGVLSGTPTGTGTFNFTVTVTDASGCLGSTAYTLTVDCPTNGANLASFPALCNNDSNYILSEGSPSGGTYSGTGVTGSSFDPSAGTQLITYSLTDVYGCPQSTSATITVNTAPTVTLNPFAAVCSNSGAVTLTGGESPAGGVFSGTGVSGNNFDPAAGSQNITYTYTDGNSCSNSASQPITVNVSPAVSLTALNDMCKDENPLTLSGGSPTGGVFSGTNVSGGVFTPSSAGTFTITYTYTDGNSCSGSASQDLTVINCLGISTYGNSLDLLIYPNPANEEFTIQFDLVETADINLQILDSDGKLIISENLNSYSGNYQKKYDSELFESGIYTIRFISGNQVITKRIVIL